MRFIVIALVASTRGQVTSCCTANEAAIVELGDLLQAVEKDLDDKFRIQLNRVKTNIY